MMMRLTVLLLLLLLLAISVSTSTSMSMSTSHASFASQTLRLLQQNETDDSEPTFNPYTPIITYSVEQLQSDLMNARELWESKGLTSHYRMAYQRTCYCAVEDRAPMVVTVVNGTKQELFHRETQQPFEDEAMLQQAYTVDSLFDLIQQGLDQSAYDIVVGYDDMYGYITSLFIDWDNQIADEERLVNVAYVQPVQEWQDTLTMHQQLWMNLDIQHYSFIFRQACECMDDVTSPKTVQVMDGKIVSVDGEPINETDTLAVARKVTVPGSLAPITELLQLIQESINDDYIYLVQATYNETYGYPMSIFIDYDEFIADEETDLYLSNFQVTPPDEVEALKGSFMSPSPDPPVMENNTTESETSGATAVIITALLWTLLAVPVLVFFVPWQHGSLL